MGQPNLFFSGGVLKVNFSIDIGFKTGKTVVGFSGLLDGSSRTILRFFLGGYICCRSTISPCAVFLQDVAVLECGGFSGIVAWMLWPF